jgi:transposase
MRQKTFRPYDQDSLLLLPPSLHDWVDPDGLAAFLSDVVDQLDLRVFLAAHEEPRGMPPYHPRMMLKVLLYGYATGVTSSRKLEERLGSDVNCMFLAGLARPDHKTIAEFRRRHLAAFSALFLEVLHLCQKAGLVKLGRIALDGTKVKANASVHRAMSYGRMVEQEAALEAEVRAIVEEAEATDAAEDARYGDARGDELPASCAAGRPAWRGSGRPGPPWSRRPGSAAAIPTRFPRRRPSATSPIPSRGSCAPSPTASSTATTPRPRWMRGTR